jgi:hypothetical protein
MTESGVLKKRTNAFHSRLWVPKGRTAATRRLVWVAIVATTAATAAGLGLVPATAPAWARKSGPCHPVTEQ